MEKKARKATTFRMEPLDQEALEAIKTYYGLMSDNQAMSYALRDVARRLQRKEKRGVPPPAFMQGKEHRA